MIAMTTNSSTSVKPLQLNAIACGCAADRVERVHGFDASMFAKADSVFLPATRRHCEFRHLAVPSLTRLAFDKTVGLHSLCARRTITRIRSVLEKPARWATVFTGKLGFGQAVASRGSAGRR